MRAYLTTLATTTTRTTTLATILTTTRTTTLATILTVAILLPACSDSQTSPEPPVAAAESSAQFGGEQNLGAGSEGVRYEIHARRPRLNRKVLGTVTDSIRGVPAAPVHSFVWDGDGSVEIRGEVTARLDPVHDTGVIRAHWHDRHGEWKFVQEVFTAPDHPSGQYLGPDGSPQLLAGDPIPVDVHLHGSSTAGGAVLPLLFNHVATWGVAHVSLNGQPFENPYDGPAPAWAAHTMLTIGSRDENGQVHTVDGGIFDPTVDPDNGAVDRDDLEFHLVFHDAPGPMTDNFPPPLSFFYHLTFEDVRVTMVDGGE